MRPQLTEHNAHRTLPDFSHIDTYQRALNGVLTVTGEIGISHRRIVLELARVLGRMKQLVEEGASEASMRAAFEVTVGGMIDDMYASDDVDFETLRHIESEHDRTEDRLQDRMGINGMTPTALEDWGKSAIVAGASSKAAGRRAISLARKMRADKEIGRQVSLDRLPATER